MSLKLKLILGALVFGAVFLGYRMVAFLSPNITQLGTQQGIAASSLTATINQSDQLLDSDHDGIPDLQETQYHTDWRNPDTDGDGYLDGEEVVSGHDPTKAGNDNLNADTNVTQSYLHRLMAGVVAGDLNPKNNDPTTQTASLQMIALATITDARSVITKNADVAKINVIPDTEENINDYGNFIKNNITGEAFQFPFYAQSARLTVALDQIKHDNPDQAIKTFTMYERFFATQAAIWRDVPVPKTFVNFHTMFLTYLTTMESHYRAAANMKSDPMLATIALNAIPNLNDKIMNDVADELIRIMTSLKTYLPGLSL